MKGLPAGLLVLLVCSPPLLAQEQDRSLERISLALQQPAPIVSPNLLLEPQSPRKLGIFTLVPPALRGEMVRVSVPIGELVTRAFKGVAAANQRRREAAARRKVERRSSGLRNSSPLPNSRRGATPPAARRAASVCEAPDPVAECLL